MARFFCPFTNSPTTRGQSQVKRLWNLFTRPKPEAPVYGIGAADLCTARVHTEIAQAAHNDACKRRDTRRMNATGKALRAARHAELAAELGRG